VLYNSQTISTDKIPYFFSDRYTGSYKTELEGFVKAVMEKKTPLVGGIDGLNAVIIGLAAQKSLREKRPVKLSEIQ
jgi:myo-inositol 2-dehydrogenase/D-chiro-inositol 1-dehydrogenase